MPIGCWALLGLFIDTPHLGDRDQVYPATEKLGLEACQDSLGLLDLDWNSEPWTASILA